MLDVLANKFHVGVNISIHRNCWTSMAERNVYAMCVLQCDRDQALEKDHFLEFHNRVL